MYLLLLLYTIKPAHTGRRPAKNLFLTHQPQSNSRLQASPMHELDSEGNRSSLPRLLPYTRHLRLARCMLGSGTLITKNGCTCKNRQRYTVQSAGSSHCTSPSEDSTFCRQPSLPTNIYQLASPSNQRLRGLDVQ